MSSPMLILYDLLFAAWSANTIVSFFRELMEQRKSARAADNDEDVIMQMRGVGIMQIKADNSPSALFYGYLINDGSLLFIFLAERRAPGEPAADSNPRCLDHDYGYLGLSEHSRGQ